jgi:nickel-dependent lactate racemase
LPVDLPETATIVRPRRAAPLPDPVSAVRRALRSPVTGPSLADVVRRQRTVVIVFPDITRPMPNHIVLPALAAELDSLGFGPERVTMLCATGTHRTATRQELAALVGPRIFDGYAIHQHVATDDDHVGVGTVDGTAVLLDRRYVEADVRIVTGFVEPHFFAGFSGGPKAVCPGVAALETILEAHSPHRIADPRATWMELDANPVHRFIASATALLPPDVSVDVALNPARAITAVFAGLLPDAHRGACDHVRHSATHELPFRCDVVVTSNAGLPLDRNLYQAVKGMSAAERVVQPGGDIVMVSSCVDGYPDGDGFARIVRHAPGPAALASADVEPALDTWQAQVLGRVLATATVHLFTDGLTPDQVRAAHLRPIEDPSQAVADLVGRGGRDARVCVLPDGPLTVVTVA